MASKTFVHCLTAPGRSAGRSRSPRTARPARLQAVRRRLWRSVFVHGLDGVRKGSKVWSVLEMAGAPVMVGRFDLRPESVVALRDLGLTVRPMRATDFVTPSAAVEALREVADVIEMDQL